MSSVFQAIAEKMKLLGLGWREKKEYERLSRGDHRRSRKGYVGIYVGEEWKRYEVPIRYFSVPIFHTLIERTQVYDAYDPLDNKIDGPIVLSCKPQVFEVWLEVVKEEDNKARGGS